jgi:hypothetical protein
MQNRIKTCTSLAAQRDGMRTVVMGNRLDAREPGSLHETRIKTAPRAKRGTEAEQLLISCGCFCWWQAW